MAGMVYYVAASIDGYIATPDGGVDWLSPFQSPGQDYGYADFLASVDGLVIGRTTFDQVLGFGPWPYDGTPCRVVTTRPLPSPPPGVEAAGSPIGAVEALGGGRLWLVGGTGLFQSCRSAGLIGEYWITVMPVLLGDGVPLFPPGPSARLRLAGSRAFPNGVVQVRYEVEGP